jgi:hypothetical protein
MSSLVDEQGHASGLFSVNGIAFLIHLASLDMYDIVFTEWYERVRAVDVSTFHHQDQK